MSRPELLPPVHYTISNLPIENERSLCPTLSNPCIFLTAIALTKEESNPPERRTPIKNKNIYVN